MNHTITSPDQLTPHEKVYAGTAVIECPACGYRSQKTVKLRGQLWIVRDDGYRFWIRPAASNPLIDREEHCALEYKHSDHEELAIEMFRHLPEAK